MIDTHCHLDKKDYENLEEVILKMKDDYIIASGYDIDSSYNVLDLVNKYDHIYGTVGIHPSDSKKYNLEDLNKIEKLLDNKKIVGIGEIGLDYYWDKDNKEQQRLFFINQIQLAQKYNLPIVIHSRDSIEETYEILNKYLNNTKAVLHCYSGSYEMALKFKKLGVKFGIGGVVTFKNSQKLKEVVEKLELTDLVIETDSPYLTPEPYRGKKNEPYNVKYVIKEIAKIKNIDEKEVEKITTETARELFDLQ